MSRNALIVPRGTLIEVDGTGIQLTCDFNEPEFDEQPFVTINTEHLAERFTHGDDNGMPIIAVHLNDATLYDDDGKPTGLKVEMPEVEDLIDAAEELRALADNYFLSPSERGVADSIGKISAMLEQVAIAQLPDGGQRDVLLEGRVDLGADAVTLSDPS